MGGSTSLLDDIEQAAAEYQPMLGTDGATADINMLHMGLFYHFINKTSRTLLPGELAEIYCRSAANCAIAHSYLMHTILAVTASHIGTLRSGKSDYYRWLSTSHQAKALSEVKPVLERVNAENCLPVLLFAHQVGIQSFHEIFTDKRLKTSFRDFLSGFVHSIGLMRGTYAVIHPWWSTLIDTEMGRIMADFQRSHSYHGKETITLYNLLSSSNLTEKDNEICRQSVISLQRQFDEARDLSDDHLATPSTVFAWLMTASSEFLALLSNARPEALVILAHYGVVLQLRRRSWVIGEAGRFLVTSICAYLGNEWQAWLEWPRSQVDC